MLAWAMCHWKRGKGNRGLSWERSSHGTPQGRCRRCGRGGWSFGRFALWIGPLWPTSRCGWRWWEQCLFCWEHQQNANAQKLAGRLCWGQSQEIISAQSCVLRAKWQKLSRRVRQPQQLGIASWDWQSLGNIPHPAPGGASRLRSCGGDRNRTAKVTLELPAHVTETRLAKGARTAADLEPLCKFTRGYGKANMEEPRESGGSG